MANGYLDFPSLYTPERKKELQYIQREFTGITAYSKRLEETWRARPAAERWGLAGLAELPLPWAARGRMPEALETLRYGYTPEQVRERAMVIGEERAELLRKRKVTTGVKRIVNHLLYLASIGTPVKTEEELKVKFPEIDTDWSDEDIAWLVETTLGIAGMSAEEIKQQMATGAFVPTEEIETPVDWEAVAAFYKKQRREDPSLVAATLAFEQDASVIKHGLEDLFKPTGVTMTPEEVEAQVEERTREMFPDASEEQVQTFISNMHDAEIDAKESDVFITLTDTEGTPMVARIEASGVVYVEDEEVGFYDEETEEFTATTTTGERLLGAGMTVVSAVGRGVEFIDRPVVMPMYANDIVGKDPKDRTPEEQHFLDLYEAQFPILDISEELALAREVGPMRKKPMFEASPELVKAFEDAVPMWKWIAYSLFNPIWWIIPGAMPIRIGLKAGQIAVKTGLSKVVVKQLLKNLGWKGSRGLTSQKAIQLAGQQGLISQHELYMLSAKQVLNQGAKLSSRHWMAIHGGRLARVALIPPAVAEGVLSLIPKGVGWIWRTISYAVARGRISRGLNDSFVRHLGEAEAKVRLEELAKVLNTDIPKLGENASTDDVLKAVAVAIHDAIRHIRSERYAKKYASNYSKELGEAMLIDATGGIAPEIAAKNTWMRISRGTTANTEKFIALMDRVVAGEVMPTEITADFIAKEFPDLVLDKEFVQFLRKYLVDSGAVKAAEAIAPIEARTTTEVAEAVSKLIGKEAEQVNLADVIRLHYSGDEAIAIEKIIYELYSKAKLGKEMSIPSFKAAIQKVFKKPPLKWKGIKEAPSFITGIGRAPQKMHWKRWTQYRGDYIEDTGFDIAARFHIHDPKKGMYSTASTVDEAIKHIDKLKGKVEVPEVTDAFLRDTLDFLGIHKIPKGMTDADVLTEGLRRMAVDINQAKIYGSATLEAEEALAEVYLRRDPVLYNAAPKAPDFASVPDGSVDIGILSLGGREIPWGKFLDTDHFVMRLAQKTGVPALHRSYMRIYYGRQAAASMQNAFRATIYRNREFRHIVRDTKALDRVTQYIRSKNPRLVAEGITSPEGLTPAEERLANVLMDLYRSYETKVRYIRFWLAYDKTGGSVKQIMRMIKGTTEADIKEACNIMEKEGRIPLEEYLSKQTWGTIASGYDPWYISAKAGLMPEPTITSFPRTGLQTRVGVEFEQMDKDIIQRTATYIRDIEFDYMMLPEIKRFDAMLGKISSKLTPKARNYVTAEMTRDIQHMKGTFKGSDAYRFAMRIYSQAMAATFWNPRLAFRNCFQIYAFYPERAKLFKYGFMGLRAQDDMFYTEIVSQLSGVTKDLMFRGQRAFPGLDAVTRFANKTSAYPHSDDIFRKLCFTGSMNQAKEAGATYLASGRTFRDYDKLLADSGLLHIEEGLRRISLQRLTTPESSYMVKGLENVKSLDAFSYEVGKAITDLTHFKYTRALRAPIEHGEAGILAFNLFTFPRSYAQRIAFKIGKLNPAKEVSIAERVAAWRDLQNIIIVGTFVGWTFKKISGSRFNPYMPWNIIKWEPGGLALSAVEELIKNPSDAISVASESLNELLGAVTGDSKAKEAAILRLTTGVPRTMRLFVPLWKEAIGVLEATITLELPGVEKIPWAQDLDINFLRWARTKLEEDYDPAYTEEIERDLIENFQHVMFRSVPPDPTKFEESQTELDESEAKLGIRDEEGHLWTLRDFGTDVMRIADTLPRDLIDESYGFSELAMARVKAEEVWFEYSELPPYPSDNKSAYLAENPEVDAWLFFWGEVSILQSEEAIINVMVLCRYYGITQEMHGTLIDEPAMYKEEREEWEMKLYEYNQWQTPEDVLNWRHYHA